MPQPGFFDLDGKLARLDSKDTLLRLNQTIDWEGFRDRLNAVREKDRKSNAGRKPFDVVLMFKALVLQHLYNLSDDNTEFMIRDRATFQRFLGINSEDAIPDAKTVWLFREKLVERHLMATLFIELDCQIEAQGYVARKGQIIDASFVEVPRQRNNRDDNEKIKNGEVPEHIEKNPAIKRQKDLDARWTKKNDETHYGYKDHLSVDVENKLIRAYEVTSAEVHDSQVVEGILADNTGDAVYLDSAYDSEGIRCMLKENGHCPRIIKKGVRNKPLTEARQRINKKFSRVRVRVEHVFGSITNEQGGMISRVIGFDRNAFKIGMINMVYNMRRLMYLNRIGMSVA